MFFGNDQGQIVLSILNLQKKLIMCHRGMIRQFSYIFYLSLALSTQTLKLMEFYLQTFLQNIINI
jgi:hypothetical protein